MVQVPIYNINAINITSISYFRKTIFKDYNYPEYTHFINN